MDRNKILIYGATGYAGGLIADEFLRRCKNVNGPQIILAGRNAKKLALLADKHGCEVRAFSLEQASLHLGDVQVVLNCAGPFSETAKPMMQAAIASGCHYLDISGEIEVFQAARALASSDSLGKRIILCPGVGFDIVPTDCLAAKLKEAFPHAHTINLAFTFGTLPSVGTMNTVIEGLSLGGVVRRGGKLTPVINGYRIRKVQFQDKRRWCVSIPWADVYTSGITTGVPNGMVLTAMPWLACHLLRATTPLRGLLATKGAEYWLKRSIRTFMSSGPDRKQRMQDRCQVWGEAIGENGERVTATLSAPNVYTLTVEAAIGIALHSLKEERSGFFTASQLMGADFGLTLPGSKFELDQSSNK